jgi:hypothetical protein
MLDRMVNKRQAIDDLIDALVWMRRKAKKKEVKRKRIRSARQ